MLRIPTYSQLLQQNFKNRTILLVNLPIKKTQRIKSTSTFFKQTYKNIKWFIQNKHEFTFGFLFSSLKEKNKTNQLLVNVQNDT